MCQTFYILLCGDFLGKSPICFEVELLVEYHFYPNFVLGNLEEWFNVYICLCLKRKICSGKKSKRNKRKVWKSHEACSKLHPRVPARVGCDSAASWEMRKDKFRPLILLARRGSSPLGVLGQCILPHHVEKERKLKKKKEKYNNCALVDYELTFLVFWRRLRQCGTW